MVVASLTVDIKPKFSFFEDFHFSSHSKRRKRQIKEEDIEGITKGTSESPESNSGSIIEGINRTTESTESNSGSISEGINRTTASTERDETEKTFSRGQDNLTISFDYREHKPDLLEEVLHPPFPVCTFHWPLSYHKI